MCDIENFTHKGLSLVVGETLVDQFLVTPAKDRRVLLDAERVGAVSELEIRMAHFILPLNSFNFGHGFCTSIISYRRRRVNVTCVTERLFVGTGVRRINLGLET